MADNNYLPADLSVGSTTTEIKSQSIEQAAQVKKDKLANTQKLQNQASIDMLQNRDRTIGEIASDSAVSILGKGSNALGQIMYGIGQNAVQGDKFDRALDRRLNQTPIGGQLSQNFEQTREIYDAQMSDPLKAAQERVKAKSTERQAGRSDRINDLLAKGNSELAATLKEEGGSALEAIKSYVSDPIAAVDVALESLPQLLVGGALGKGLSAKGAGRAALANTAVSEGASNAVQAQADVQKMTHEQLAKDSPMYNELIKTMAPDEARGRVADQTFAITQVLAGSVGAVTGKLTSKFEGNLFNKNSGLGSILNGAIGAGKEGVEEALQGAGGQAGSNIAKKVTANKNQEIAEGTGEAAGTGTVAGALSGGAIGAVTASPKVVEKVAKTTAKATKKAAETVTEAASAVTGAKAVREAIKTGDTSKLESDADMFEAKVGLIKDDKSPEKIAELNAHAVASVDKAIKDFQAADPEADRSKELAALTKAKEMKDIVTGLKDTDSDPKVTQEKIDTLLKSSEPKDEEVTRVLGSMETIPTEKLTQLADSPVSSDKQSTAIKAHLDTRQAVEAVDALTTGSVNSDVIHGGKGKMGMKEYQSDIQIAVDGGDIDVARTKLIEMGVFAKRHMKKAREFHNAYNAVTSNAPNAQELVSKVQSDYGVEIHINSDSIKGGQLISTITSEAKALQAGYKESAAIASNVFQDKPVATPKEIKQDVPVTDIQEITDEQQTQPIQTEQVKESTVKKNKVPVVPANPVKQRPVARTTVTQRAKSTVKLLRTPNDSDQKVKALSKQIDTMVAGLSERFDDVQADRYLTEVERGINDASKGLILKTKQNQAYDKGVSLAKQSKVNKTYSLAESALGDNTNAEYVTKQFSPKSGDEKTVLQSTPDFISNISSVTTDLTPKQSLTLDHVVQFDTHVANTFQEIYKPKNQKFLHEDMIGALANQDGSFDKNTISAIGIAAYNWAATRASGTLFNDQAAINGILGERGDTEIVPGAWKVLARVGTPRATVAEGIGSDITKMLGIKANKDADGATKANMNMSVGQMALTILLDSGVITETEITNETLDAFRDGESDSPNATTPFVRIAVTEDGGIAPAAEQFITNLADSDDVMKKLFDLESNVTTPLYEAPTEGPTTVKGSNQKVSDEANRIVAKHQKRPHKLYENKMNIFNSLSQLGKEIISGVVQDVESTTHVSLVDSVKSKNESLIKDIKALEDFEADNEQREFFFKHEIWKNARIGMVSNTVNPQSSKIHRHLLGPSDWEIQIDPSNKRLMDNFFSAVGLGIGISVDKQNVEKSVTQVKELMSSQVMLDAMQAINETQSDTVTNQEANEQAILAAVKAGGEKVHSLEAIIAYSEYLAAEGKPFQTSLTPEVDGITNGIMIGSIQFAATDGDIKETLGRGGMYFDGKTTSYADKKSEAGFNDSYEDMAFDWIEAIKAILPKSGIPKKELNALKRLVGSFQVENKADGTLRISKDGRNKAKPVLMTNVYGASVKNVVKAFNQGVTDKLYEDLAKHKDNPRELQALADTLNTLMGTNYQITTDNALQFELEPKHITWIQETVADTYGKALEATIEAKFAVFIKKRTDTNNALKVMFEAFKIRYDKMVAEQSKGGKELSDEQLDAIMSELYDSMPIVKHAMSQSMEDGILVMGQENVRQYDDAHKVEQSYGRPIKGTTNIRNGKQKSKSLAHTSKRVLRDGGVSGAILSIHAIDAATMLLSMDKTSILGVHDAIFASLTEIDDATVNLNKGFHKTNADFSIMDSVASSLESVINTLHKEDMKKGTSNISELNHVLENGMFKPKKDDVAFGGVDSFVKGYRDSANETTTAKNKLMGEMTSNGQYFLDGSDYTPNQSTEQAQDFIDTIAKEQAKTDSIVKELFDAFGSDPEAIDPEKFNGTKIDVIDSMTSRAVFTKLGTMGNVVDTIEHTNQLESVLTDLVNPTVETLSLKLLTSGATTHGTISDTDVYINLAGTAPNNGTQMSAQEVYIHELVHSVTSAGIGSDSSASRELRKLFTEVSKQIKPEDFLNKNDSGDVLDLNGNVITTTDSSYANELEAATKRHDYIFKNKTLVNGRNPYLDEFVALGMTNKQFRKALEGMTYRGKDTEKLIDWEDFIGSFQRIFAHVVDTLTSRITGVNNIAADKALMVLAQQVSGIEYRSKNKVYRHIQDMGDVLNGHIQTGVKFVVEPLVDIMANNKMMQSKYAFVRNVGGITSKATRTNWESFTQVMKQVTRRMGMQRDSLANSLATEIQGRTAENGKWHDLLRMSNKMIDQTRLAIQTGVKAQLNESFLTEISKEEKDAINKIMTKTDLTVLLDTMSWSDIASLVRDDKLLAAEVTNYQNQLTQFTDEQHYYRKMSKSLGNFMATGMFSEHQSMMNAHNIANMYGTGLETDIDTSKAEPIIDVLATLHAIQKSDTKYKKLFGDLVDREHAEDNVNNGITFTGQVLINNKSKSLDESFNGQKALMVKGYTKEIFNPNISIAFGSKEDETAYLREGYTLVREVKRDIADPNNAPLFLYRSTTDALNTHMAGIVSNTSKRAKGSDLINNRSQTGSVNPSLDAVSDSAVISKRKSNTVSQLLKSGSTETTETLLVPIVDGQGNISGYRYMMNESNKLELLEKTDSFDEVIGHMESSITDKTNSADMNEKVVQAAWDEYLETYSKDPSDFVWIGKNSAREADKEIYQLMPKDMRDEVKRVWGKDGMFVRKNLVPLIFGQRKISAASALAETKIFKKLNEDVFNMFGFSIQQKLGMAESVWQEIIKTVKDTIVIKSGVVLAGNVGSNLILLKTLGVSAKDIATHHATAIRSATAYQRDIAELGKLERELEVNPNVVDRQGKEVRVAQLTDSIEKNPVKELIDEGVYQSIVEDISLVDDQYAYKNKLQEMVSPKVPRFLKDNPAIEFVAQHGFITHDTKLYKALRDATQLSDFVARYTLHEHNKAKGMDAKDSINQIIDIFINYDLPTHKGIQYANDIGLLMFTKFFVRIQKVIAHIITKHPANTLAVMGVQGMLGDYSDIMDSNIVTTSVLDKFNFNPIDVAGGALDVPIVNLVD